MQKVQVLVVEDEKIVAADIRQNLTMLGYAVPAVLASGEEAIKRAAEESPDLVLMDIQLKGRIDGIEAAKIVQTRLNVPVVFITAFADDATIQRAKSTEPYGYIVKPFGKRELQSTIEIALHKYNRERRLKTNEQWITSVFRSMGEGAIAVDQTGSVCLMNAVAEAITGSALEDSLGAHWQDLWTFPEPRYCGGTSDPVSAAMNGTSTIDLIYCPVRFKNRGDRIIMGSIAPIRERSGRLSGAVIAMRDVSKGRTLEIQYRQARHLAALQRLAGGVAHNLNTALPVISGYTESLLQSLDGSDPRFRDLQMIEEATEKAGGLIRQLMAFSRRHPAQPERLDLNEIITRLQQVLKQSAGAHVQIELNLQPGLSAIETDPQHLEQIIMSLATNACDAMAQGGLLGITTSQVHLNSEAVNKFVDVSPGEYVLLQIRDTGGGIDNDSQGQVFEPFFTKKSPQATGLALAAVYGLVKQAGGHIWFESEPGNGTEFSVCWPIRTEARGVHKENALSNLRGGTETILVVDDDAASRQFVAEALTPLGYRVLQASNGHEALKICEQISAIHLVLSDVLLPNMTAFELKNRMAGIGCVCKMLLMSSFSPYALKHHGAVGEDTALLQKPISAELLADRVREALEN